MSSIYLNVKGFNKNIPGGATKRGVVDCFGSASF